MGQTQVRSCGLCEVLSARATNARARTVRAGQIWAWKLDAREMALTPIARGAALERFESDECYAVLYARAGSTDEPCDAAVAKAPAALQRAVRSALRACGNATPLCQPFCVRRVGIGQDPAHVATYRLYVLPGASASALSRALAFADACRLRQDLAAAADEARADKTFASWPPMGELVADWDSGSSEGADEKVEAVLREAVGAQVPGGPEYPNVRRLLQSGRIGARAKPPGANKRRAPGAPRDYTVAEAVAKRGRLNLDGVPRVTGLETKTRKMAIFQNDCTEVADGLFVSGAAVAKNMLLLQQKGITHVVNCAGDVVPNHFPDDFEYFTLYLLDSPSEDILSVVYPVAKFIKQARQSRRARGSPARILINCHQGVSRSCAVAIAMIMIDDNLAYNDAYRRVRSRRRVAHPNVSFVCELLAWGARREGKDARGGGGGVSLYRVGPHAPGKSTLVVCRRVPDDRAGPKALDARGVFVIRLTERVVIWVGGEVASANRGPFLAAARAHVETMQAFERAPGRVDEASGNRGGFDVAELLGAKPGTPIGTRRCFDVEYSPGALSGSVRAPKVGGTSATLAAGNPGPTAPRGGRGGRGWLDAAREAAAGNDEKRPMAPRGRPSRGMDEDDDAEPDNVDEDDDAASGDDSGDGDSFESELYEYPSFEALTHFSTDDLFEDRVYALLVTSRAGARARLYVWIGDGFEMPDEYDDDTEAFGVAVEEAFRAAHADALDGCDDYRMCVELEDEESEEFFAGFKEG